MFFNLRLNLIKTHFTTSNKMQYSHNKCCLNIDEIFVFKCETNFCQFINLLINNTITYWYCIICFV